ncbi:hypothetical protein BLNAU_12626 [Blattamonas nauphoetae]|uniref:Uncharacterized protein n=1 Tax=Blattamonas nauphoetae TaxID=2049346 RepID=A0ABQ9XLK9_9EUKA|nr:hypothetical protein BLNAU_12626 [Blattamonas nauphoetae]
MNSSGFRLRDGLTDPLVEVINTGLYDYKQQLTDYFREVTAEIDVHSPTLDMVDDLQAESDNILTRYAEYILGYVTVRAQRTEGESGDSASFEEIMNLKFKLEEANEAQRKAQKQNDMLKGQLDRRDRLLAEQRGMFYKELLNLREQMFQKKRLGQPYVPENGTLFNPDQWLDSMLNKGSDEDDAEKEKKMTQKIMDKLGAKFADERKKLESQMKILERERSQQIHDLEREYNNQISDLQNRLLRLTEDRNAELEALNALHKQEMDDLRASLEERMNAMISEKEMIIAKLKADYDDLMKTGVEQLKREKEALLAQIEELEKEIARLKQQLAEYRQSIEDLNNAKLAVENELKRIMKEREALQEKINEMKSMGSLHDGQLDEMNKRIAELERELAQWASAFAELGGNPEDVLRRLRELEEEARRAKEEARRAREEADDAQALLRKRGEDLSDEDLNFKSRAFVDGKDEAGENNKKGQIDELALAAKRDRELKQKRAVNNWALLTSRLRNRAMLERLQRIRNQSDTESGGEDDLWKSLNRKQRSKKYPKLGYLERMRQKQLEAEERLRTLRELIEQERRRNLEKVLRAVELLSEPTYVDEVFDMEHTSDNEMLFQKTTATVITVPPLATLPTRPTSSYANTRSYQPHFSTGRSSAEPTDGPNYITMASSPYSASMTSRNRSRFDQTFSTPNRTPVKREMTRPHSAVTPSSNKQTMRRGVLFTPPKTFRRSKENDVASTRRRGMTPQPSSPVTSPLKATQRTSHSPAGIVDMDSTLLMERPKSRPRSGERSEEGSKYTISTAGFKRPVSAHQPLFPMMSPQANPQNRHHSPTEKEADSPKRHHSGGTQPISRYYATNIIRRAPTPPYDDET